jgi:ribonuclease Z
MLHRRGALLFDLGDLAPLPARDLLRVGHVFVTHTHIDHFIGFDALLRVLVGRERRIAMVGPRGFADRVEHKLLAYEWDLIDRYETDLVFDVTELHEGGRTSAARFRFKRAFCREALPDGMTDGIVATGEGFEVRAVLLEHHGPSIGYALAEPAHVNIWRNRLAEKGLSPGPWLQALKRAVLEGAGDDCPIRLADGREAPLGSLREMLSVTPGQKVVYVTDVADTPANRRAIISLAESADILFLESRFVAEDEAQARQRAHLTTRAAGEIARSAGVRRLEPFHFSARYEDRGAQSLIDEVAVAFAG